MIQCITIWCALHRDATLCVALVNLKLKVDIQIFMPKEWNLMTSSLLFGGLSVAFLYSLEISLTLAITFD